MSTVPVPEKLWPHFPHCSHCHERAWAATTYRHPQDPRGPLKLAKNGICPHYGKDLYAKQSKGDTMSENRFEQYANREGVMVAFHTMARSAPSRALPDLVDEAVARIAELTPKPVVDEAARERAMGVLRWHIHNRGHFHNGTVVPVTTVPVDEIITPDVIDRIIDALGYTTPDPPAAPPSIHCSNCDDRRCMACCSREIHPVCAEDCVECCSSPTPAVELDADPCVDVDHNTLAVIFGLTDWYSCRHFPDRLGIDVDGQRATIYRDEALAVRVRIGGRG